MMFPGPIHPIPCVYAGKLLIPQEHLYKQNVLLIRGQFRPFTLLHNDMLMGAAQQFFCGPDETSIMEAETGHSDHSAVFDECVYREDSTVLLELTTRSMMEVGFALKARSSNTIGKVEMADTSWWVRGGGWLGGFNGDLKMMEIEVLLRSASLCKLCVLPSPLTLCYP